MTWTDWARVGELVANWGFLPLAGIDAGLIERLDVIRIATLDRLHFAVVRPGHTDALALLP